MNYYIESIDELQNSYNLTDNFLNTKIKDEKIKNIEMIKEMITDAEEAKTIEIMDAIHNFFNCLSIKHDIEPEIVDKIADAYFNHFNWYDKDYEYLLYY